MSQQDQATSADPADLYAHKLRFDAFARPCGCNQGTGQGESCVLYAPLPGGGIALRDSKHGEAGELRFTADEFKAFLNTPEAKAFLA